jgi:hypothetical protein
MSAPMFPWLPPAADGGADDDPWGDVDVPEVALTAAQEAFLATFAEQQPAVPRVRHLDDPLAAFEEP